MMNSLRLLHNCFKSAEEFRATFLEKHGFTLKNLDGIVTESLYLFNDSHSQQDWDTFMNACSMVSVILDCFPERSREFSSMIVPLIAIVKEKTDAVRKTAAVCLAKISQTDEENGKLMRFHHGTEVLVSLGGALAK